MGRTMERFYVTYIVQRTANSEAVKYRAGNYSTLDDAQKEITSLVELMRIGWHSIEIQITRGDFN